MPFPVFLFASLALSTTAGAAIPTLSDTLQVHSQDFDQLPESDFASHSVLPDGWNVIETGSKADTTLYADDGRSSLGNSHSYGAQGSTDRALGMLSSSTVQGRIEFRVINLTGQSVDSVHVRFAVETWRFGVGGLDSVIATRRTNSGSEKLVPALTVQLEDVGEDAANPNANATARIVDATIPVSLASDDTLVLSWTDPNIPAMDDGWGIDDFQLRLSHFGEGSEPPPPPPPTVRLVSIHDIQGIGSTSPFRDSILTFQGVVTASFQAADQLRCFYVQNPDHLTDSDPRTSEGIMVYTGNSPIPVFEGDSVQVRGKVAEYFGLTEITEPVVTLLGYAKQLPSATDLTLPLDSLNAPERLEGMRVRLPQELVVTGNGVLGSLGSFSVSPRRLMAATQVASPGAPARAAMRADSLNRLLVNDGFGRANPINVPFPTGNLGASNSLRGGDKVSGLVGVLDFGRDRWTLQPTHAPIFKPANPRTSNPSSPSGKLRVASFNLKNYFTTLGAAATCGPMRNLECRGATDPVEFRRQKSKIASAIHRLDADVVALMDIENLRSDSALLDLVQVLNDSSAPGTWSHVPTGPLGTEAIKVALIHRASSAPRVDSIAILDASIDPDFLDSLNRSSLAATFRDPSSGKSLTVVVNDLKSRTTPCIGDPDLGDGQGHCNQVRTRAARVLAKWARSRPTGTSSEHILLLGDLNAYAKEDPIRLLQDSGFVDLVVRDGGDSTYSYQFENTFGSLDHALASPSLAPYAKSIRWAINADEPVVLDYNRELKTTSQVASFYAPDPYASSDHDPVLVDLDFSVPVGAGRTPSRSLLVVRTQEGIALDAGSGYSEGSYLILSPSGEHVSRGSLDESGRCLLRSALRGTVVVRIAAPGVAPFARLVLLP